jgi:RimJ/RimL family protein N-acetyltransferase
MLISPGWEERFTLRDGSTAILRLLRPEDAVHLREGFERLSPTSRYRRFLSPIERLSDGDLAYLTELDQHHHLAIVALCESADLKAETGIGVARYVRSATDPDVAEAAVTVVDDFQRQGVAKHLLSALGRAALERNIRKFRAEVLHSNEPIKRLLAEMGAVEVERDEETGFYDIPIDPGDTAQVSGSLFTLLRLAASSVAVVFHQLWLPGERAMGVLKGRPPEDTEDAPVEAPAPGPDPAAPAGESG